MNSGDHTINAVCGQCHSKPPEDGYAVCATCRKKQSAKLREERKAAKALHLCVYCLRTRAVKDKTLCPDCAEQKRIAWRKQRAERKALAERTGSCVRCLMEPRGENYQNCDACQQKIRDALNRSYQKKTKAST